MCNKEIKFKTFLNHALEIGASHIATGHYARVKHSKGRYRLLKAKDSNKDQTYFLYALNQQQLSKSWFPIVAKSYLSLLISLNSNSPP